MQNNTDPLLHRASSPLLMMASLLLLLITVCISFAPHEAQARDISGRLGVGTSNQVATDLPSISFKIMNGPDFGMGGLLGFSSNNSGGGYAAGLKFYRVIYDEPHLQFYASGMGAILKRNTTAGSQSGFQLDVTLGSEFAFQSIESIGLSFEFGVSMNKIDEFVLETVGYHIIKAAIHFYI